MAQAKLTRFTQAEQVRNTWNYTVEAGHSYDDLFDAAYWAHIASTELVKAYDFFEIRADEGTYIARLLVLEVNRQSIRFAEDKFTDLVKAKKSAPLNVGKGMYVKWCGPHAKWRVLRPAKLVGQPDDIMEEGLADEVSANAWLAANRKSLAA